MFLDFCHECLIDVHHAISTSSMRTCMESFNARNRREKSRSAMKSGMARHACTSSGYLYLNGVPSCVGVSVLAYLAK